MSAGRIRTGVVVAFDAERGLGTVREASGRELGFHCTAVADGSRQIDEGAHVLFVVRPGHRGRYEARDLVIVQ
jgi:cold shock CspA family protein